MSQPTQTAVTTEQVKEMLRARLLDLSRPEGFQGGAFCDEVTHQRTGRRADVIFMGMTNSKGRTLQGFEIKVSRADWLRELRDADKSDTWADECHSWTIVALEGVVLDGELPSGFGLLEVRTAKASGKVRLVSVVKPKEYETRTPSWEAIFSFMARMESMSEKKRQNSIEKALENQKALVQQLNKEVHDARTEMVKSRRAQQLVDKLAEAGIDFAPHDFYSKPDKISLDHFTTLMAEYLHAGSSVLKAVEEVEKSVRGRGLKAVTEAASSLESELRMLQRYKDKLSD